MIQFRFRFVAILSTIMTFCHLFGAIGAEPAEDWKPLFNGKNLEGWNVVIDNSKSDDPNHLVQIDNGALHMYKNAKPDSKQPAGYIETQKKYSNYRLRIQYMWGTNRFIPRIKSRRDAGLLYHIGGNDGVWPKCVECQIQENDVGDIFMIHTRATALIDPAKTNEPAFLDPSQGGIEFLRGMAGAGGDYARVIRNPMNEHDGWNTVEIIVRGDESTYIVNGKVNNRLTKITEMEDGKWVPLKEGKIGLQLEYAEVYYRNIEIQEMKP